MQLKFNNAFLPSPLSNNAAITFAIRTMLRHLLARSFAAGRRAHTLPAALRHVPPLGVRTAPRTLRPINNTRAYGVTGGANFPPAARFDDTHFITRANNFGADAQG